MCVGWLGVKLQSLGPGLGTSSTPSITLSQRPSGEVVTILSTLTETKKGRFFSRVNERFRRRCAHHPQLTRRVDSPCPMFRGPLA